MSGLPPVRVHYPHVRVDAGVLDGSPYVGDAPRIPVRRLWAWYRGGASIDTVVKHYPRLGAAKVLDALSFALDNPKVLEADLARERAGSTTS